MTPDDDELRRRVSAAYDDVLREPVPDRLSRLLEEPAPVTDLAAERARRRARPGKPALREWSWAQWGGMAASLAIGVVAGVLGSQRFSGDGASDALVIERDGRVLAGAPLAQALDTRLASDAGGRVSVQLSFVDRAGQYCRTFSAQSVAGLACRQGGQWDVVTTAQSAAPATGGMRQAASSLPRAVLDAVDARIAGSALDAAQERAAREHGWQR